MAAGFHGLQPFVVDAHRLLQSAGQLRILLASQETGLVGGRQGLQHQLAIVVGFSLILCLHHVQSGVVSQLAVHVVIGLVIDAERQRVDTTGVYGVQNVQCFVVHTDV